MDWLTKEGQTTNVQLQDAIYKMKLPVNAISWKDQLYNMQPKPGGYIVNMENSVNCNGGTHWIALFLTNERGEHKTYYFDSFGVDPPQDVVMFAKSWGPDLIHSCKQIQQLNSNFCGQYCLDFIHTMATRPKVQTPTEAYVKFLNKYKTIRRL